MTGLKRLEIEYDGINGIIREYTKDAIVVNYLAKLKEGIDNRDFTLVKYSLKELVDWYSTNILEIQNNPYARHFDSHQKNSIVLREIYDSIKIEDFTEKTTSNDINSKKEKVIFLSHKSNDKKYADMLRDFIVGLGVKNEQLIYTSHPLHKIPMDANIFDYLRKNISSEIFMIILWSNDYLESPACLNEMGAAWVTQSDYTNVYVPTFSFGNPKYHECAVDTRKIGAVLNGDAHCKANLRELKNKILSMFDLKDNEQDSAYLIDEFIRKISEVQNG